MNELTMLVSCIETYSHLKNIPDYCVFTSLQENGVLKTMCESNQLFPDMDLGFYIGMIDGLLLLESDEEQKQYQKHKERIALLTEVIEMLCTQRDIDFVTGCTIYFTSDIAKKVAEDETAFYQKSAIEILQQI